MMAASPAALALFAALAPRLSDPPALALPWLPVRAPPVAHLSPDGRLMVTLERDEVFGRVEILTIFADPNTRRARQIFRSIGDTPLRFLRWQEVRTAELEFPPQGDEPAYRLRLSCGDEDLHIEPRTRRRKAVGTRSGQLRRGSSCPRADRD